MARQTTLRRVEPSTPHSSVYRAICRFSTTRLGLWLSEHVAWKLDPYLMGLTGGRLRSTGPLGSALLETRGARTGALRRTAALYFHDGDSVIIIASKRGDPRHPAWFHNLRANPVVSFGGLPFRAEVVEAESERQRLWSLADRVFPPFARYREWAGAAGRVIPIVRLTPAPGWSGAGPG